MCQRMQSQQSVAMRLNEQMCSKRKFPFIRRAWLPIILVLWIMILALVSRSIYNTVDAEDKERRREALESMCDQRARILQDQFSANVNHVHSLSVLVSTFHYSMSPSTIDQKTFADYAARAAFERPLLSGVAYAQRVLNSERKEFERQHGWTIRTMKKKVPSPIRDEYAPVVFSQQTISYIESVDMMSGEEDRVNILRARATGKTVLTRPFRLLGSHQLGVVLTFPVYKYNLSLNPTVKQRIVATAGYLGGAFDVESLVRNLLGKLSESEAIAVNVCDITNSSQPLMMYGSQCKDGSDTLLKRVSTLDFGDSYRKHHMICRYLKDAPTSWTAITTAFLFFVIGVLVGYSVYSALIHIVKVEDDFNQMQQLKVQAEAVDVAKSQFLATLSHEIRTPMNGILGMLSLILDTNLTSTQKDFAQTALACGKSLVTLINEVLDRAKIEAGKLELESVPFNVRSILDDILSLFSEKSRDKGVELAVLVSENVPFSVIGDPGRFRQVITNLIDNSVKFTERGHIFVHVHLAKHTKAALDKKSETCSNHRSGSAVRSDDCKFKTLSGFKAADDRNCWDDLYHLTANEEQQSRGSNENSENVILLVCVEDTGIGIPLHAQEKLYMPFMQAESSTSRNYGGTGIGLTISKCLIQLMGGEIGFVSCPEIGSTFSFTANFKVCDKNEVDHLKKSLGEDLPAEFEGMKAILVDEGPLRAAITRYHFSRLGVVVEVVSSIAVAISKNGSLRSRNQRLPDMVLVEKDTWISSEDGLEKNGHVFKFSKMILLATKITDAEIEKAKEAGFEDVVIMKPLTASLIAACLQQVLGIRKKAQQKNVVVRGSGVLRGLLRGKKILVVDDNKVNRIVAAGALKKFGANVVCVDSGKAAVALFQSPHDFDACFMDIQMPEMDGFEATRLIRKLEVEANKVERHVPILAMTADVIHATRDKCLKCGMDGYVSKPFEEEDLYQAVARFFEPKQVDPAQY